MAKDKTRKEAAEAYKPAPADLSDVILPESLTELTEVIAENTHEVWSANRMAEGWKWGPVRDDSKLEHPNLVPYCELSEADRDYDRATAMNAIKLIVKMGFKIDKQ